MAPAAVQPIIDREAATPLSNAEIYRLARDIVTAERGARPATTGQLHWTGYRTNSDEAEMARIDGHFAVIHAGRAWDRRVKEVCRQIEAGGAFVMARRTPKPSADVFAVADKVPNKSDLTAGKLYKLSAGEIFAADEFGCDRGFVIFDDVGHELYCLWKECAHLNHADWRRVSASGEAI